MNTKHAPKYLIVPAAGKSTRYPGVAPKFLLSHPSGPTMLEMSISGLKNLKKAGYTKVFVISTAANLRDVNTSLIERGIEARTGIPCIVHQLEKETESIIETLTAFLSSLPTDAEIVVKDCDNFVSMDMLVFDKAPFSLAYASLSDFPEVSAPNKS